MPLPLQITLTCVLVLILFAAALAFAPIFWVLLLLELVASIWAAWDSAKLGMTKYNTVMSLHPAFVFLVILVPSLFSGALLFMVVFSIYLSARNKVIQGKAGPSVSVGSCQTCQRHAPLKYVEFFQNIGAVVLRFHKSIKGNLCKSCIHQYFWKYTLITLAVGWLGVISCFVAPIFIVMNLLRYLGCLSMPTNISGNMAQATDIRDLMP